MQNTELHKTGFLGEMPVIAVSRQENSVRSVRAINDIISSVFPVERCVYLCPDDISDIGITADPPLGFREITGRRERNGMAVVLFPESMMDIAMLSVVDAVSIISDVYAELAMRSSVMASPVAKEYRGSVRILLHSLIWRYIMKSVMGSRSGLMEFHRKSMEVHDGDIGVSVPDALMIQDILADIGSGTGVLDAGIPKGLDSVALMGQAWERCHQLLVDRIWKSCKTPAVLN